MQDQEPKLEEAQQAEPVAPVVEEEDFLAGSAPACNLGEECESCQ